MPQVLQKLTVGLADQFFSTERNAQNGTIVHLLLRALVGLALLDQMDVNGIWTDGDLFPLKFFSV